MVPRLGFEVIGEHQFEPGFPLYVFVRRGDVHLHLSEHTGDVQSRSLAYFVDEVDSIARRVRRPRRDRPRGREVELADPCGNHLRLGVVPDR